MKQEASFAADSHGMGPEPSGSTRTVYLGILQDLEAGRMVPGQRLIETDLASRFEVGRNAVREAMQHLSVRGVVDLSRNRSPSIRRLDTAETFEVLEVAQAMTALAVRAAAAGFAEQHGPLLAAAMEGLDRAAGDDEPAAFSRARRNFYRVLLLIGGNRELQRLFPAIGIHIIHAQYPSPKLRGIRLADYQAIAHAVADRDADAAERAARTHVDNVRVVIRDLMKPDS